MTRYLYMTHGYVGKGKMLEMFRTPRFMNCRKYRLTEMGIDWKDPKHL